MKKAAFVAEPKQRIAKNKALAKNILRTTQQLTHCVNPIKNFILGLGRGFFVYL